MVLPTTRPSYVYYICLFEEGRHLQEMTFSGGDFVVIDGDGQRHQADAHAEGDEQFLLFSFGYEKHANKNKQSEINLLRMSYIA